MEKISPKSVDTYLELIKIQFIYIYKQETMNEWNTRYFYNNVKNMQELWANPTKGNKTSMEKVIKLFRKSWKKT